MLDFIRSEEPSFKFEMSDAMLSKLAKFVAPHVHQLILQNQSVEDTRQLRDSDGFHRLSVRARNCLRDGEIETVQEAKRIVTGEKQIRSCGVTVRHEIALFLIVDFGVTKFN